MKEARTDLVEKLINVVQSLSVEKLLTVLDFAGYLQNRETSRPERGSAQALLRHFGTFRLDPQERDSLLDDIMNLRTLDMGSHA